MIKEELNKAIDMQEEFGNPFIVIHKPKAKNKIVEFDSDTAAFDMQEDNVMFDFWELEGFNIKMTDIKSVVFENAFTEMTIVHIKLKNGNTVMLNFLHK
jgi:hypothetical protein